VTDSGTSTAVSDVPTLLALETAGSRCSAVCGFSTKPTTPPESPTRTMPNPERAQRLGTLVASGLIVGESIWGVINAGLIVGFSKDAPIALVPEEFALAPWLGVIGFVGAIVWLYGWMLRRSRAVVR